MTLAQKIQTIGYILNELEVAILRTGNLRNGYRVDRVAGMVSSNSFCSYGHDLDNLFKHVPGFPDMSLDFGNILQLCNELSPSLLTDYEKLVKTMVYLEQTIGEENYYSAGQYTPDLEALHTSIKDAMCNFDRLESQCVPSQSSLNSTDLVRNYEQTTNDEERHIRDYLLVKDIHILLQGFWVKYNKCHILFNDAY
ncbi:uncharacterized protein [Argopecten irradians]|uniref:uncharacterized protein n=1 Tax=Argopecten irradians TaxID=31199 RepID=UPI0037217635